jgi:hypothetical protein
MRVNSDSAIVLTMSNEKPVVLWIDDSLGELFGRDEWFMEFINDTIEFEIVLLGDTDEAVEFALEKHDRIFMFIQDSARLPGTIVPAWKNIRSMAGPSLGANSGDFYTYVIDGFAPMASAVFAGFSFSRDEQALINEWASLDPRIVWANKFTLDFPAPGLKWRSESDLVSIARAQLKRWQDAGSNEELSPDGQLLKPLGEELAVVCGSRSSSI